MKIKKGDRLKCIEKPEEWYDITVGEIYVAVTDSYFIYRIGNSYEFVEIEYNDSSEPYTNWLSECFEIVKK